MKEIYFAMQNIYGLERKFCEAAKLTTIIHSSLLIIH